MLLLYNQRLGRMCMFLNRAEAVESLKEVLCASDFTFPDAFSLDKKSESAYEVRIKVNSRDKLTIRTVAKSLGLDVNEEKDAIIIH